MKAIAYHNGRTAPIIAAALLKRHYTLSTLEVREDVFTMKRDYRASNVHEDLTDVDVFLIGETLPVNEMLKYFDSCKSITYIGNENNSGKHEVHPFLKVMGDKGHYMASKNGDLASAVLTWLKSADMLPPDAQYPILDYLSYNKGSKEQISNLYRTLGSAHITVEAADAFLDYTEEDIAVAIKCGDVLSKAHDDTIRRIVATELRSIALTDTITVTNGCGSNKKYASYLAELLAREGNGVGLCYYDTAEFRHFEIRMYGESKLDLKALVKEHKGSLTNGGKAARFRVERSHPLAQV